MVCPDKLRGSVDARHAAAAIAEGLQAGGVSDVTLLPLADGGEGTLDVLLGSAGGSRRRAPVTGPLGDRLDAAFGVLPDGTAVVEMAEASGLARVERNDPLRASTRGTGELIRAALNSPRVTSLIVGVGGSATTDGGLAAVQALGWTLGRADVTVACDVTTRFTEAASRFGAQKGASAAEVELLTRRLEFIAQTYEERTGVDVTDLAGGGAAGGLAGGLAALGARLESGFDVVAETVGLAAALDGATLVVTGEGRVDDSSFEGKVVGRVLAAARDAGVAHRAVLAGSVTASARNHLSSEEVTTLALTARAFDADDAVARAPLLLKEAAIELARSLG